MKYLHIILIAILALASGSCTGKSSKSDNSVIDESNKVFKGHWVYKEEPLDAGLDSYIMTFNIDLYAKTIDNNGEMTHGGFYVNNGFHEGSGDITSVQVDGNEAHIEYLDPAGLTYSATLTYYPKTRQLKFEDGEYINKGTEDDESGSSFQGEYHRAIPVKQILEIVDNEGDHL